MKIYNKRKLQKITFNHLADIDHKDFMKIYKKFTSEPFYALNIDSIHYQLQIFKILKKSFRFFIKMILTDEFKVLGEKIKANQAQYDLDRETTNISALSSKELDKYEYLIGEDLGYNPGLVEKVKFECSPLAEALD